MYKEKLMKLMDKLRKKTDEKILNDAKLDQRSTEQLREDIAKQFEKVSRDIVQMLGMKSRATINALDRIHEASGWVDTGIAWAQHNREQMEHGKVTDSAG